MSTSTRERMFSLIESWQSSGKSQQFFCKDHDIKYATFHYWYKKYRETHKAEASVPSHFVPVTFSGGGEELFASIEVAGGGRITLHQPVSADYLLSLLR